MKNEDLLIRFGDYLKYEKRYSDHTLESYVRDCRQLIDYLLYQYNITDLREVTHHQTRSWVVHLLRDKNKAVSIRRKLSSITHLFKWMRRSGVIHHNPVLKVQLPKIPDRLPKSIPAKILKELWQSPVIEGEGTYSQIRDKALIGLLYGCGLRRSEVIKLIWSDYDENRQILKVIGKGRKHRNVPVGEELRQTLKELRKSSLEAFNPEKYIEIILMENGKPCYPKFVHNKVVGLLGTVTTAEKRSPHTLRHSMATHLMDEGAELNAVKAILGHSSLAATQVYTHNSISRLKEIYRKSHPNAG